MGLERLRTLHRTSYHLKNHDGEQNKIIANPSIHVNIAVHSLQFIAHVMLVLPFKSATEMTAPQSYLHDLVQGNDHHFVIMPEAIAEYKVVRKLPSWSRGEKV